MMVESKDTIVSRIRILEKMLKYREYYLKELAEKEDWNTYNLVVACDSKEIGDELFYIKMFLKNEGFE